MVVIECPWRGCDGKVDLEVELSKLMKDRKVGMFTVYCVKCKNYVAIVNVSKGDKQEVE